MAMLRLGLLLGAVVCGTGREASRGPARAAARTARGRLRLLGFPRPRHRAPDKAGLFAAHDRARFEVRLYSYGRADASDWRQRLVAGSDAFVDIAGLGLCEAARRIRADGVGVLVDLKGFTRDGRPELFALRPAPVQVNYLGYPGTMGASWYDGFITDEVCSPS